MNRSPRQLGFTRALAVGVAFTLVAATVALVPTVASARASNSLDNRGFTATPPAARAAQPHQFGLAIAVILTPLGKGRFDWEGAMVEIDEGQKPRGGLVKGTCERGHPRGRFALVCLGTRFAFTDQDTFTMAIDASEARLEQRYRNRLHTVRWTAQGEPLHDARQCPDDGTAVTLVRPTAVEGHLFGHHRLAAPRRGEVLLNFLLKRVTTTPCLKESSTHSSELSASGVSLVISGEDASVEALFSKVP